MTPSESGRPQVGGTCCSHLFLPRHLEAIADTESALAQLQKPVFPRVSGAGSDPQHSSRDRTGETQGAGLVN